MAETGEKSILEVWTKREKSENGHLGLRRTNWPQAKTYPQKMEIRGTCGLMGIIICSPFFGKMLTVLSRHLGSGNSVRLLEEAQREGMPITAETCHHYLNLVSDEIPDGSAEFKCCPPIRDHWHRDKLWDAIKKVKHNWNIVSMNRKFCFML